MAPSAPVIVNNIATFTLTAVSAGSASVTDTASFSMEVEQAEVAVSKTAELPDPMPLEPFDYTISITDSGTVQAYDVVVSDVLPGTISFRGPVLYDADGPGAIFTPAVLAGAYSMGTVTVNIGSLGAGVTATVSFEVEVTGEIPSGTAILNSAALRLTTGTITISYPPIQELLLWQVEAASISKAASAHMSIRETCCRSRSQSRTPATAQIT